MVTKRTHLKEYIATDKDLDFLDDLRSFYCPPPHHKELFSRPKRKRKRKSWIVVLIESFFKMIQWFFKVIKKYSK
jgi:hypothetical protein